jgi:asparagine synthase (glutamine-hydrolysing)
MFTVPIGEWFRTESHGWLAQLLRGSGLLQELFEPRQIDRMLASHRDGSANFTRELRALAAVALWSAKELA